MTYGFRALLLTSVLVVSMGAVLVKDWQANARAPEPLAGYSIYLWDRGVPPVLYAYHTGTCAIDTLDLPCVPSRGVTASAAGDRLYLAADSEIVVVSVRTLAMEAVLPYRSRGPVVVSPDSRLVAVMGDSLVVLSTADYRPVFSSAGAVREGVFADDSRSLYCVELSEAPGVLVVRFGKEGAWSGRIPLHDGCPVHVVPDRTGERLFVQLKIQDLLDRVAVVDLRSGLETYSEFIFPGDGRLASTPGWDRIVYTNSGRAGGPEGSSSFKIFDFATNRPTGEVNTRRFVNDSIPEAFPVGEAVVTPDHRRLIALDAPEGRQLLVYDLGQGRFLDWVPLGEEASVTGLTVQLRP